MITFYGDRKEGWTTMERRLDHQGRWRHKTVAFRVSQEESEQIDRMVRLSGLTKQDYIIRRLQCQDIAGSDGADLSGIKTHKKRRGTE